MVLIDTDQVNQYETFNFVSVCAVLVQIQSVDVSQCCCHCRQFQSLSLLVIHPQPFNEFFS